MPFALSIPMKSRLLAGLSFGATVASAAAIGAQFNPEQGTETGRWYRSLDKATLNPPDQLFAPVWTLLYTAMATSAYRVWSASSGDERRRALQYWGLQLGLNAAWSPTFFGAKRPAASLALLGALIPSQLLYMRAARDIDRPAFWLFVPYLAWVLFATYLNAEIVRRNR